MGTPGRVSRKCAARLHRSSQGAPCPIRTTPTDSCERSRFRAAREPRAEITGCPSDWRISSRIDSKLSRNSTCTIAVIVLRIACPSEQSCAETRRNLGSFRWERQVLAVAIASKPHRRQEMPLPKPNWACSHPPYLPTPSLRRKVIIGHQLVNPD
jgi:hypothetical protein